MRPAAGRTGTWRLAVLLTSTALALAAGCTGSDPAAGGRTPVAPAEVLGGPSQEVTAVLDAAVADVDARRAELLAGPGTVVTAVMALDAVDEAASRGALSAARQARGSVGADLATARAALDATAALISAYRGALAQLVTAGAPLEPGMVQALTEVAAGGEQEASAVQAFTAAADGGWPAYVALDQAQAVWVQRAAAGWYRTEAESADAYAVLLGPQRSGLEQARATLARADTLRLAGTERQRAAFSAADRALAPLRRG